MISSPLLVLVEHRRVFRQGIRLDHLVDVDGEVGAARRSSSKPPKPKIRPQFARRAGVILEDQPISLMRVPNR